MPDKKKKAEISDKVKPLLNMKDAKTDPNGSYTGVPSNPYDMPVQDADDLQLLYMLRIISGHNLHKNKIYEHGENL